MFVNFTFSDRQINNYFQSAKRDFLLASYKEAEIKFQFSYNCFLKLAQAVCARKGLRVKSSSGHHAALFLKYAEIFKDDMSAAVAQAMRDKRNRDLYDGGIIISDKEAETYYQFVKKAMVKVENYLSLTK
jgi:hypothetical protein